MPIKFYNPIPIYEHDVEEHEFYKIKEEINTKLSNSMFSTTTWHDIVGTTVEYNRNIIAELQLNSLKSMLELHTGIFLNQLEIKKPFLLKESWFNKLEKNGFQSIHRHTPEDDFLSTSYFSGIYFWKESQTEMEPVEFHLWNGYQNLSCTKEFIPGRLLIFYASLPHKVNYNKNNEIRHSFSFNIKLKDEL